MSSFTTDGTCSASRAIEGAIVVRTLLIRGMLAGLVAGLLVFGFARLFGEPQVDRAISFESAMDDAKAKHDAAHGMPVQEEPELVSRPVQAGLGLFTGVTVYATAFGGLFALVFAVANNRMARLGPRAVSALLAAAGFVCVYLVPILKYPANPPSVGQPETIGDRTALYFIMMAVSVAAMVIALMLRGRLAARGSAWNAALISAAFYLAIVTATSFLLPGINEVPDGFPATVLWQFRIASFGMQVVMWTTLGLLFGVLAERALAGPAAALPRGGLGYKV